MRHLRAVIALIVLLCLPCAALAGQEQAPARRVVSLYAAHTENLAAMGAADLLVGVSEPFGDLPVLSPRDGAEAVAALKPDLVLVRPMHATMQPGFIQQLERLGIRVASLQPTAPAELEPYWLELGRLTGREPQAKALAEAFRREMAALDAAVAAVPAEKRPRVFFESIHRQMKTVSPGSMAAFVLKHAGGRNAAPDAEPVSGSNIAQFGLERLVAEGDAVDVYLAQKGPMNPVTIEEIKATPGLASLKAVREGRVYLVDEALTSRPTPRLAEGVRAVAALLHPGLIPPTGGAQ